MTTTWIAAFSLLALLVTVETILLLALMRQMGVLSMRINPVPAAEDADAGPARGTVLAEATLEPANDLNGFSTPFSRDLSLLFFVSPTCGLCTTLLKPLAALQKTHPELDVFLIGEVTAERAADYVGRAGSRLPTFVAPGLFEHWQVRGTPFAAVVDAERRVVRSGVVNTLEQLEVLIERAEATVESEREVEAASNGTDDAERREAPQAEGGVPR
jgi:hypothetical protein